jgi:hypothetical protein
MVEKLDLVMLRALVYVIKHVIINAVNHAQQRVGLDVVMHVLLHVEIFARAVLLYAIPHVRRNVKMLQAMPALKLEQ